ncbi:MAG: hypothetical protein ACM3TR_08040 [Caulobacteraceae bacterium]
MTDKNIEMMKKIIEEKRKKSAEQGAVSRNGFNTDSRKPFKRNKKSGK